MTRSKKMETSLNWFLKVKALCLSKILRAFLKPFLQFFHIPNPLVKIWWKMEWVTFNSSPIILTTNLRSERTRSWILSTFSSVLENKGLQLVVHLPSENALNHRKIWALHKSVSVGLLKLALHWAHLKTHHCSKLMSLIFRRY